MKDEMGILREVGTTAAAHGSNALYKMLGHKVSLELPRLSAVNKHDFLKGIQSDDVVICVECKILSGLGSKVLLTLTEKSAYRLIRVLCKPEYSASGVITEMALSTIKEIGNVVIGAYLSAMGMYLKTVVIPAPPSLLSGSYSHVMNSALNVNEEGYVMVVDAVFEEKKEKINGAMQIFMTDKDMEIIQKDCKSRLGL
jgi:chemotaxis protein CheC